MTYCEYAIILVLTLVHLQKGEDLSGDGQKFNVVMFFAKTSASTPCTQDSGIKYLNFIEKTRVKHSAPLGDTSEDALSSYTSTGSDCSELLKSGIFSLIGYCRNVMGMTTAIASVENDTFSNGLRFKKSTSEDLEIRYHYPRGLRGGTGVSFDPTNSNKAPPYITEPEHTEVFKIRSKRENLPDEVPPNFEPSDKIDPNWDVFGIMANIKLTFFGKIFEQDKNSNKGFMEKAQNHVMNELGKVSENNLFDLVKETLAGVQNCDGFLMIVIGGSLGEIADIYSSLMQSIKHVVENTDEKNTLIVLTGSCPTIDPTNQNPDFSIPVYVRGPPKASGISTPVQLYDVPYVVKNMLAEMHGGNYLTGIRASRSKRHISKTKNKRNKAYLKKKSILSTTLCIFSLFLVN